MCGKGLALVPSGLRHFAYLVAPVTLSYVKAGKPVNFPGTVTITLRKGESGWRISGVAWADH